MARIDRETYIAGLPVGAVSWAAESEAAGVSAINIDDLPDGVVTGSNLIDFTGVARPEIRSAVALSLLAAQRVAANDTVILNPDQWIARHNMVLENLNWLVEAGALADAEFKSLDVAVHKAIIPFLTAALGVAGAAASLIITALEQLKEMDKDSPWIALFERESRRFDVSEYQFSYVSSDADQTVLRMAAARLDASYGRTQVLFFKVKRNHAKFLAASSKMRAQVSLLEEMNTALKKKLGVQADLYIRDMNVGGA